MTGKKTRFGLWAAALVLLLCGCSAARGGVFYSAVPHSGYQQALRAMLPESQPLPSHQSVFASLERGAAGETVDVTALPVIQSHPEYHWYPQFLATPVIAVDRSRCRSAVTGWESLRGIPDRVSLGPNTDMRLLLGSISYALAGEHFTLDPAIGLLSDIRDQHRLSIEDYDAPVLICWDYQAAAMRRENKDLEIIIPAEGTLTFERGLLSPFAIDFGSQAPQAAAAAGLRALDGSCDPSLYPSAAAYAPAVRLQDYSYLNAATADSTMLLRRKVQKDHLFSSADQREHMLFALLTIAAIVLWCGAVIQRAAQRRTRVQLLSIGALLVGWIALRYLKWQIIRPSQYLWYGYYFFQLGFTLMLVWLAWSVDQPGNDIRPPRWWLWCAGANALLFLLIFTNSLHHLAFRFDPADPLWSHNYTYGPVYFAAVGMMALQVLAAQGILIYKTMRSPRRQLVFVPLLIILLFFVYGIGYALRVPLAFQSDITITTCVFCLLFVEACLRTGLVPVNTKYTALFRYSPLRMQIVDREGVCRLSSAFASPVPPGTVQRLLAGENPLAQDNDTLLYGDPITGGSVLWQEDIRALNETYRETSALVERLQATNALLRQEAREKNKAAIFATRQQIMDELESELSEKAVQLPRMAEALKQAPDRKAATARLTLLVCYIKRRCNLFFIAHDRGAMPAGELAVYFDELSDIAGYAGVTALTTFEPKQPLPMAESALLYEFFYTLLAWAAETGCPFVLTQLAVEGHALVLKAMPSKPGNPGGTDPALLRRVREVGGTLEYKRTEDAEGLWLTFPEGGEPVE